MSFNRFPLDIPRNVRAQKMATYWTQDRGEAPRDSWRDAGWWRRHVPAQRATALHGRLPAGVASAAAGRAAAAGGLLRRVAGLFHRAGPTHRGWPRVHASDTAASQQVIIINQSTARHYWPNESPIGKHVVGNGPNSMLTVVGVTADVRQQLDRAPHDEVYLPLYQVPFLNTTWVIHSSLPIDQIAKAVKAASLRARPELPVSNFRTLAEVRSSGLESRRVTTSLIGMFGLLALVITAAGIAGVVAFSVNQRTQEFGIRMALGAPRTGVLGMVVRQGLALVSIGLVIGMAGAILLTRLLTTLLFEIEPTDALTFLAVSTVLLMVAVVACLMPARRAASVDPIVALRAL